MKKNFGLLICTLMLGSTLTPSIASAKGDVKPQITPALTKINVLNISDAENVNSANDMAIQNDAQGTQDASNDIMVMIDRQTFSKMDASKKAALVAKLKDTLDNEKYILIYGNADNALSEQTIYNMLGLPQGIVTKYKDDRAKQQQKSLFAIGVVKQANGHYHTDSYFGAPDKDFKHLTTQMDFVERGFKSSLKIKDNEPNQNITGVNTEDVNTNPTDIKSYYIDNNPWGQFQSTVYVAKTIINSSLSLWDVKMSNTSVPGDPLSGYYYADTAQQITRSSVQGFSSEQIVDHGPTTTSSGQSASVNLSNSGASVGWSFPLGQVSVTDDYHPAPADNYGRWIFNFNDGSEAEASYKSEPGARFTNRSGNFVVDNSHTVAYDSDFHGAGGPYYTGVLEVVEPDL